MHRLASISVDNQIILTGKFEIFMETMSILIKMSFMFHVSYQLSILFTGGWDSDAYLVSDVILQFNKVTSKFIEVGKLEQRRDQHSISLVKTNDYTCA